MLLFISQARENPFFPAEGIKDLPLSSNIIDTYAPLKRAAVALPDSARVIKEVTVRYQNLDGSIDTKSISLDHSVDWHLPLFISQSYGDIEPLESEEPARKQTYKQLVDFGEASFWQRGKTMRIRTDDMPIRHFMMIEPHRMVIDFKRDASFRSKTHKIDGKPFTNVRLGNHKGYYRAVIELDGQYRCSVEKQPGSVDVSCR